MSIDIEELDKYYDSSEDDMNQMKEKKINNEVYSVISSIVFRKKSNFEELENALIKNFDSVYFEDRLFVEEKIYFLNRIKKTLYELLNEYPALEKEYSSEDIENFKKTFEEKLYKIDLKLSFKKNNIDFNSNYNNDTLKDILKKYFDKGDLIDDMVCDTVKNLSSTKIELLSNNNKETMDMYKEILTKMYKDLSLIFNESSQYLSPFRVARRVYDELYDPIDRKGLNGKLFKNITMHILSVDLKNKDLDIDVAELIYNLSAEEIEDVHLRNFLNKEGKIVDPVSTSLNLKFGMIGVNEDYERYTEYALNKYSSFAREDVYKRLVSDLNKEELLNLRNLINQNDFILPNVNNLDKCCEEQIQKINNTPKVKFKF